jgi:outer membrane protein insertion porin family
MESFRFMKKIQLILLFLSLCFSASALIIKDIQILNQKGESYDMSSVAAFTSFTVGQEVPGKEEIRNAIAIDVERMRESGRYSFVNAFMQVEPDGIVLVYTVVSKKKLRRIEILGADKMRNRKVRKKSGLELGQFADDTTFAIAAEKIKEAYRDFWYPYTEVKWDMQTDEKLGTVDVTYHIKEGEKLAIKHVVFEGNDSIEAKVLKKVIQQKQKKWYSFLTGSGKYKPDEVDADVFALKSYYMNEGFLDVQVSDPVLDETDPKKSKMIFRIKEGQRYRVGKISISGMKAFSEEDLRRGILLKTGDVAAYKRAEAGTESLRAFYGNRGYVRARVQPVFDPDAEAGTVDIRYEVSEGPTGYIDQINITGNERTKDKVIRRELVIYPGDKYNRARVKTSENRLRNLNYFEVVSALPEPTDKEGAYDLNVKVKEKPTGQFSAGVGFSSIDSLVGYIELSQGNFDIKRWPPVGAGQKFKIRAQLGTERNDLDISFVEPWFLNRKLSFGTDLFHHESRYFSDDYEQQ